MVTWSPLSWKREKKINMVTCIEIFYISLQEQGKVVAEERLKLIEDLPLVQEPLDKMLIRMVGKIKASKAMSFADSCIAGLAMVKNAILVHKDPEFEQLNEVEQLKLKYKKS